MRKNIVAGNWKMNKNAAETKQLISDLKSSLEGVKPNGRVIIAPTFVNLSKAVEETEGTIIEVAAQNMHQAASGAYTGEISADMLVSVGIKTVILGHSERREYFGETDQLLAEKVDAALAQGLEVIFCFGETLEDRQLDNQLLEVGSQIKKSLFHLPAEAWKNIILAYEPVWAIGTGETATPEQAQDMHAFVRKIVSKKYSQEIGDDVSILYGGSVKPANAKEIFSKADVDGGLIGGASLKAPDFTDIIKSM
jgi:triosephosphate isomerase